MAASLCFARLRGASFAGGLSCLGAIGCTPEGARIPVVQGAAPELRSWGGSTDCCGEDPHPVHGAWLGANSIALVGKASAGSDSTAGFVTRWTTPDELAGPEFIDGGAHIDRTRSLLADSSLVQVMHYEGSVLVAGFRATSASARARAHLLVLDAESLEPEAELRLRGDADRSAAFESLSVDGQGFVVVGGASGFARSDLEGFKSYGNIVGGSGRLLRFQLAELRDLGAGGATVDAEDLASLQSLEIPRVHSLKSLVHVVDGRLAAIGHDDERATSGLVVVDPELSEHRWVGVDASVELTDLSVFIGPDSAPRIAVVGHGGEQTGIDGYLGLFELAVAGLEGVQERWSVAFGDPGLDPADLPDKGLAPDKFIFDECWGVVQWGETLVAACGTGIESCRAVSATEAQRRRCRQDPRRSWRSYLVAHHADGSFAWSRAESFVTAEGEVFESAAEELFVGAGGDLFVVQDHSFGVGLARFAWPD